MLKLSAILLLVVVACAAESLTRNDKGLLKVSNFACKVYSGLYISSPFHYRLDKITNAERTREADGELYYYVILIMRETNCKKQDMSFDEASECDFQTAYKKCAFKVRDEDQNRDYKIISSICGLF